MRNENLEKLLMDFKEGKLTIDETISRLKPFEDIGIAKVDTQRELRTGYPEVIYGSGKTAKQIVKIVDSLIKNRAGVILITRLSKKKAKKLKEKFLLNYDKVSKIGIIGKFREPTSSGQVIVVTGGTSDIPVAREAELTLKAYGIRTKEIYDVGVAGIHRLLTFEGDLSEASCIIAVAGMEGALPSVIGGLVDCPVIAVPTSVGYGTSFGGVTALLSMLNSCSSGICVVNIDNGFGAGYLASMIAK